VSAENNKTGDGDAARMVVSSWDYWKSAYLQDQCQNFDDADGVRYPIGGFGVKDQYW
jgi:hypothetical protein